MKHLSFPIVLFAAFLQIPAGFAGQAVESQSPTPTSSPSPGESEKRAETVFKKIQEHQYSGSKLKGQLKKPDLSYIYQRKGLRDERIVNVPENFDEEIISGAQQF
jgi:hypothetical protein